MLRKIVYWSAGVVLAVVIVAVIGIWRWQEGRLSPPGPAAAAALVSDAAVTVLDDDWLVFEPAGKTPVAGIVFYPGAHCPIEGYAPLLRAVAERGYRVIATPMPLYLAFLAPDRANDVMARYPDTKRWVIAGHSLGGAMAASFAYRNPDATEAVIIVDSHPPEYESLSDYEDPVLMIHRASPDGTPPVMYQERMHLFPGHTRFVPVRGGGHMDFGDFVVGESRADELGDLGSDLQQAMTAIAIGEFLASAL